MSLRPLIVPMFVAASLCAHSVRAQSEPGTPQPQAQEKEQAETPPPQPEPPSQTPEGQPQQPEAPQQPSQPEPPAQPPQENQENADQPTPPTPPADRSPAKARDGNRSGEGERGAQDAQRPDAAAPRNPGLSTTERDGRLVVTTVEPRLAQIGIRRDDVIVEVDGQPITRSADLNRRLIAVRPGARIPIIVIRGGVRRTIYWSPIVAYGPNDADAPDGYIDYEDDAPASNAYLGVTFNPRYPNAAVVLTVVPGSPADQCGLQPGDVIVRLDGQRARSAANLSRMVSRHPPGQELELQFSRLQTTQVRLGERGARVEAGRVPYESEGVSPAPIEQPLPPRDGRLFDGDRRLIDRRP